MKVVLRNPRREIEILGPLRVHALLDRLEVQRESASGEAPDFEPQVVDVLVHDGRPAYRLGSRILSDKAALAAALAPLKKELGLFVRVEPGPNAGFVVSAIQAGHDAGFTKVTYVAAE